MKSVDAAQNIDDLRLLAKKRLPKGVYEFIARGSEDEMGLRHNRQVLDSIKIKPRVLTDVTGRSTACLLLGRSQAMPLAVAPTGAAGLLWYHGEAALARATGRMGIPCCVAMSSITPLAKVRRATDGELWLQLYLTADPEANRALIEQARQLRFDGLIVTVDTVVSPNREYNWRNGFNLPIRVNRRNALDLASHPAWTFGVIGRYLLDRQMPSLQPLQRDESAQWSAIQQIRDLWPGALVIKGIGCVEDGLAALQTGAEAIVLSNHGARNLDSACSPMQVLPHLARALAGRLPIWIDSGFMRGSDIFKALASGASAVLTGRATLYGLAAGGEAGVMRSLTLLREELDRCMAYAGVRNIAHIGAQHLQAASAPSPSARSAHDQATEP